MNIGLLGYGKMGRLVEKIAKQRGHNCPVIIDKETDPIDYSKFDVAINFSTPESAFDLISNCLDHGIAVISGTTGWLERYPKIVAQCKAQEGSFLYASNFSLGVNLFFALNEQLSRLISPTGQYQPAIKEIHHIHKLDAPSGTAISLAEPIIRDFELENYSSTPKEKHLHIESERVGEVPGTHTINYHSEVDLIQISHEAKNRNGFALGAVIAAEWIKDKKGVFSMKDVLSI